MSITRFFTLGVAMLVFCGCKASEPPTSSFAVTFTTEADPGVPLMGVGVSIDGKPAGTSTQDGIVQTYVRGPVGKRTKVQYECPEGHRHSGDEPTLQLRHFQGVGESGVRGMELKLRCPPSQRIAAFAVRVEGSESLPVFLNGKPVGQTNAFGVAHFSTRGVPGTEYSVTIDTSSKPNLRPQNPTKHFTLPDDDEVFVVAQAFELYRKPKQKRRRRPRIIKIE